MTTTNNALFTALIALAGTACGQAIDDHHPPAPLVTLRGTLAATPAEVPSDPISMAFIWATSAEFGDSSRLDYHLPLPTMSDCDLPPSQITSFTPNNRVVSESVTFQPQFPIQFELPLNTLPPLDAQIDLSMHGGSGHLAAGFVIAYVDGNHNGQYDIPMPGNAPDSLVASSTPATPSSDSSGTVLLLDGTLPTDISNDFSLQGLPVPQGFSILGVEHHPHAPLNQPETTYLIKSATTSIPLSPVTDPMVMAELEREALCGEVEFDIAVGGPPQDGGIDQCKIGTTVYNRWQTGLVHSAPCTFTLSAGYHCTTDPVSWEHECQ